MAKKKVQILLDNKRPARFMTKSIGIGCSTSSEIALALVLRVAFLHLTSGTKRISSPELNGRM